MWHDLTSVDPRFVHEGERARYVRFPLGGIGAGGFSISGSGRLVDWSIRNRPALGSFNGYTHFAVKAERGDTLVDARVLNGPYDGDPSGSPGQRPMFDGFGHGANRQSLVGVPHFRHVRFYGRFPAADLTFEDARFPGAVRMTALSPFIPHNDRDSGMPAALFEVAIANTTDAPLTYTVAGTLGNHGANSGRHVFRAEGGISSLSMASADPDIAEADRGDVTIATDADDVQHQDYHFRGQWFDDLSVFWKDFARPGPLPERRYEARRPTRHMHLQPEHGTLAARITVPPGEERRLRFVISWSFPKGDIYWAYRNKPDGAAPARTTPLWTNYYATQWADSEASAREALARWPVLAGGTLGFRDALFGSLLPAEILDAAASTLALLRTATVIRLDNGALWAWEGQHTRDGSCEGSCTHVWNYQQALSRLFPALERTLRETEWTYNQLPSGGLTFRQKLPLGSGFDIIGPCADGHFGAIVKTYREWRLSGDTQWLARYWPHVKRALAYAWSPDNPDRWDPEATGLLSGRQHHTLDMELFGPNSWLASIYVAALLAGARMAEAMGEADFAVRLEAMGRHGAAQIDGALNNGEWYQQAISLGDRSILEPFDTGRNAGVLADSLMDAYWSEEHGEVKYQFGAACITDQVLGQWHAEIVGLGLFLDEARLEKALAAIYRHNFRPSLEDHFNPCRNYAYEDEGGLLLATWPEGVRAPVVPAPYAEEVWTGLEYMAASHMIMHGMLEEGLAVVRAARDRYDGARRNPFNDIECGSYYARSMSAWALVDALSGFHADAVEASLRFAPRIDGDGRLFWAGGTAWGILERAGGRLTLAVLGGALEVREVAISGARLRLDAPRRLAAGDRLVLEEAGGELTLADDAMVAL